MRFSFCRFLLDKDDGLYRLPNTKFEQMLRDPTSHRLPRFAGARVRMTDVAVELQDRQPIRVVRITFGFLTFDGEGYFDASAFDRHQRAREELQWASQIGVELAAKAIPDGYTMAMGQTSNLAVNPNLYSKLPYDSLKDLAPVTLVSSMPIAIMAWAKAPYATLGELIAAAKAKPNSLTLASTGNGTIGHLSGELLQRAAAVKFIHVPYKGAAQAFPDLLGGRLAVFHASVETALPQIRAGTIRALAVTASKRVPALPGVPTVAESGYHGVEASTWFGLVVPAHTPAPIVARLSAATARVLSKPEMHERLASAGEEVKIGPEAFTAVLRADLAKWGRVVKEAGIKVE